MQVSLPTVSVHQNLFHSSKFEEDFSFKLRLNTREDELPLHTLNDDLTPSQENDDGVEVREDEVEFEVEVEEEEEEEEFSFACTSFNGSPISADDIFLNGQIRPVFPIFNRELLFSDSESKTNSSSSSKAGPPVRTLFVEKNDSQASTEKQEEPFCAWTGKAAEASQHVCKKSNSTGFSKLRRFRELVLRSNSDGKDAFVFLNHHNQHNNNNNEGKIEKSSVKAEKSKKVVEKKAKSSAKKSSAHEKLYVRNKAKKEEHKRQSYLPYRVGFFTNLNGLSRNVHPY